MNPYIFPVCCHICGGEGLGDIHVMSGAWTGSVVHSDPNVCRANLEAQRRAMEAKMNKKPSDAGAI